MTSMSIERNLFLTSPMMRGNDVLAVQRALAGQGARLTQDGLFGVATAAAIRAFQTRAGLVPDGIAGVATRAALMGGAGTSGPSDGAARRCFDLLEGSWSPEQACGILANIAAESGFDPAAVGDRGSAYGLAQWHPDRQEVFRQQHGRSIVGSTVEDQIAFITYEMTQGREQRAGRMLQAAHTAREAGEIVSRFYERPAAGEAEALRRGLGAESFLAGLRGAPPQAPAPGHAIPPPRTVEDVLTAARLEALLKPHRMFRDGTAWYLSGDGISFVEEQAATTSDTERDQVRRALDLHGARFASILAQGQVPIELVLAAICAAAPSNSGLGVLPGADLIDPDRTPRAARGGLMQTTLILARAATGQPDLSIADLQAPETAIRAGVATMWLQAVETGYDPPLVAAMYSAGSLRYDPRNRWRLLQYPQGGPDYIDRFIRHFNAAMQLTGSMALPPRISSFHRLLDVPAGPPSPPDGQGRYVAPNPTVWIGSPPVGTGECVALVQRAAGAPATARWRRGNRVQGDMTLLVGTAIATFDDNGSYGNRVDGTCHAALYLGQGADGIEVVDQWKGHAPDRRTLSFDKPEKKKVDQGESFYVIA